MRRVKRSSIVVMAVTLQRLLEDPFRHFAAEEDMVLDAFREVMPGLKAATPQQLAAYVAKLDNDQLRGVISSVKGKYHELLVEAAENADGDAVSAVRAEATNQPGFDLEFILDGEVIEQVQLKATASPSYLLEHFARYPDIEVMATNEIAQQFETVRSSGFSNQEMEEHVRETLSREYGDEFLEQLAEGGATSLLVGAALVARRAVEERKVDSKELKAAMGDLGVGVMTAFVLETLLI